jgi:hypothetical protein
LFFLGSPLDGAQGRKVLRNAVELAGLHEAVALAYAAESGRARE